MKMDTERPHRTTSNNSSTSELFVCFTSRLSSSSMKLSSKSILSPSRSREPPQISLSSSLSRRLRNNGSMKGGQASPMFPTMGGKRRGGCGFENPEPSSPKVTCIGQVRVKTKKQGKKMRSRSKRRSEASFRKTEHSFQVGGNPDLTRQNSQSFQYQNHQNLQQECLKHRNQRWVHLPLTICEALREFSCFFPCRSSCMSKEEKDCASGAEGSGGANSKEGSCGAAYARWLVALQEGDGKGREIELVMEEDHDGNGRGNNNAERSYSQRRHVFEDIDMDVVEEKNKKDEEFGGEEEEKARVSICIPPKNALLLMRCRSDPVKMAALANRFWESPVQKDHDKDEEEDEDNDEEEDEDEDEEGGEDQHIEMEEDEDVERKTEEESNSTCEREKEAGFVNSEENHVILLKAAEPPEVQERFEIESRANPEGNEVHEPNQAKEIEEEKYEDEERNAIHQGETFSCVSSLEVHADLEKPETEEVHPSMKNLKKEQENDESSELSSTPSTFIASEPQNDDANAESEAKAKAEAEVIATVVEASAEGSTEDEEEEEEKGTAEGLPEKQDEEKTDPTREGSDPRNDPEPENGSKEEEREKEKESLPECLLLMMCEPKLSMEVSKETWVCSTDFVRWLPPERLAGKTDTTVEKKVSIGSKPKKPSPQPFLQPPRSSCSFPAAPPAAGGLAGMIEQKLVGSKSNNGYEPFVLTRCKSEPVRSSAKLAPEACFWKNRKLEPATLGVGPPARVGC